MHAKALLEQFTLQGPGFARGSPVRSPVGLNLIVKLSKLRSGNVDSVLDMGCGPGIVACALAKGGAKKVVGFDSTPTMVELAKQEAKTQQLANVSFQEGDVYSTGLPDNSFDVVVSRFVIHHLERPVEAIKEMRRVAKRRVVLAEVTPMSECAAPLNSLEKLRDRSHVAFYPQAELISMMAQAGLHNPRTESYRIDSPLSEWLARSYFETEKDKEEFVHRIFEDMRLNDGTGLDLRLSKQGHDVIWSHLVSVLAADKQ